MAASGPLMVALYSFRALLAHSPAFQTWVASGGGEANATEAMRHVHVMMYPEVPFTGIYSPEQFAVQSRPGVMLTFYDKRNRGGKPWVARRVGMGSYAVRGKLLLQIENDYEPPPDGDMNDLLVRFDNTIGAVLNDIRSLSGQVYYLTASDIAAGARGIIIRSISPLMPRVASDFAESMAVGCKVEASYIVEFGT